MILVNYRQKKWKKKKRSQFLKRTMFLICWDGWVFYWRFWLYQFTLFVIPIDNGLMKSLCDSCWLRADEINETNQFLEGTDYVLHRLSTCRLVLYRRFKSYPIHPCVFLVLLLEADENYKLKEREGSLLSSNDIIFLLWETFKGRQINSYFVTRLSSFYPK